MAIERTTNCHESCSSQFGIRQLGKDLLEGQMEISNFEQNNPPPVDLYAKTAEIMEARFRFIELVRELAEKSGIDLEDPD